ncbi:MAG: hypothetical protein JNG88_04175 [Phycisphaerales bacterium]|nr:hypothetical protein [Phycisphaerales bacterium]
MVDGRPIAAEVGQTVETEIHGTKVRLCVNAKSHRTFRAAGVEFRYPMTHAFEFSSELGYRQWSLDGNDNVVLVVAIEGSDVDTARKEFSQQSAGLPGGKLTPGASKLRHYKALPNRLRNCWNCWTRIR